MKAKYILSIMALLIGASCSDDNENTPGFTLDEKEIQMEAVGGTREVRVSVPGNWTATPSESWVQVSPTNGKSSEICVIKVDTTILANKQREAIINFKTRNDAETRSLKIVQAGFDKALTLSTTSVELENYADYGKRYFDVEVTSNVDFKVDIPQDAATWLSYDKYKFTLDCGARPRKTTIRFNWEGNTDATNREAKINFLVAEGNEDMVKHDTLLISQERAPEITPTREGDSLALVIIERKLNVAVKWDKNESLMNWPQVKLWEEQDKGCTPGNLGRVRAVEFSQFITKEGIPDEIRYLTELETLSFFSNGNKFMYSFDTGTAITQLTKLKNLRIYSFGLTTLPPDFVNLKNLVTLDLSSNNFQEVPAILTPENFPNLRHLSLATNRRGHEIDLTGTARYPKEEWGGLYGSNNNNNSNLSNPMLERLFKWENLESLVLSNNIIKGTLPKMAYGVPKYTKEEVEANDTLKTAASVLVGKPKVLPHCKDLRIGLNYLHGDLPDWLLHHPYLMFWSPEISIFNQNRGKDDQGIMPGFSNVPTSFEYFYELYPILKPKY